MAANQPNNPMAVAFAQSLLDLAQERQQAEPAGQELRDVRQVVESDPMFRAFLTDPAIARADRDAVIERVFGSQLSPLVHNFLKVAVDRGAAGLIPQMSEAYDDLLDELLGKVEADVTVAQRLSPEDLELVRQRIGQALKKDVVVYQYVDEEIIGGMVIRVGDQLIDGSVRAQLDDMRDRLLSARPR